MLHGRMQSGRCKHLRRWQWQSARGSWTRSWRASTLGRWRAPVTGDALRTENTVSSIRHPAAHVAYCIAASAGISGNSSKMGGGWSGGPRACFSSRHTIVCMQRKGATLVPDAAGAVAVCPAWTAVWQLATLVCFRSARASCAFVVSATRGAVRLWAYADERRRYSDAAAGQEAQGGQQDGGNRGRGQIQPR